MHERHGDVLSWASLAEEGLIERAQRLAAMPFVVGHVALMPDAHIGLGSDIGTVFATDGAIIPSAIGVDIGCGMIAVRTTLTSASLPDDLGPLHAAVGRAIPAGVGKGHDHLAAGAGLVPPPSTRLGDRDLTRMRAQFGTLGSGNHFVEVCLDELDRVWIVLHSGSRGIGNMLAQRHIGAAKGLMRELQVSLPDPDLAYLVQDDPAFDAYIADMRWAQDYAYGSRERMMDAALGCLARLVGAGSAAALEVERINSHHNYTTRERHHGRDVWLTRKGAVAAREGQLGIIPGSMATATYIVRGLGNPASYLSCAHGAGRRLSRTRARKELKADDLERAMAGKAWNRDAKRLLDEAPMAYKDIDAVMADQRDLVEPVARLTQILNYKGL
jgi:tRNA-splicing ligase RtcB